MRWALGRRQSYGVERQLFGALAEGMFRQRQGGGSSLCVRFHGVRTRANAVATTKIGVANFTNSYAVILIASLRA